MIFLLTGVAAAATVAFRGLTPRTAMLAGCLVLLAGDCDAAYCYRHWHVSATG